MVVIDDVVVVREFTEEEMALIASFGDRVHVWSFPWQEADLLERLAAQEGNGGH